MSFRFIHTADLHLDAPLKAIALRDAALAREVGVASRTSFSRIVDLCIREEVAFLLIAGDLWDGAYSSTKTPRYLKQELLRLRAAGIGCYMIRGNHDAMARQTGELDLPDNTHLFGAKAGTVTQEVNGHLVALHGLSFRDIHAPESLLPRYPAPVAGAFNIGLMHTSLNGGQGHDPYAPCTLSELNTHGFDYWALGHIHRRAEYLGAATVVMPGTPQARDIGEAGQTSVTMVAVDDHNQMQLTRHCVAPLRFDRLDIDCTEITQWSDLLRKLEDGIATRAKAPREEDHLVIRPTFHGSTALAWRMARDSDQLTEEARAFAHNHQIWIDKLDLRPLTAAGRMQSTLPDELVAGVMQDLSLDPGLEAELIKSVEELQAALPPELRDIFGVSEEELSQTCRELLQLGAPQILSALIHEGN